MPGIREIATGTMKRNSERTTPSTSAPVVEEQSTQRKPLASLPDSAAGYSDRSPIAKAYRSGVMPPDHRRLLNAIKETLTETEGEGATEGKIQLEMVLEKTGIFRASALKMLQHMQNFGVLETKRGYRCTWVKILKN